MNLVDLIEALRDAEKVAEKLWPNAEEHHITFVEEDGILISFTVTDPAARPHSCYRVTL